MDAVADIRSSLDLNQIAQYLGTSPEEAGVVVDEAKAVFGTGDFLIRNVTGVDPDRRGVAVGAQVEVGTTVQFHVRDAGSADE